MKKAPLTTFTRQLTAVDKTGKTKTSFIAQPYCLGMYVCIEPGTIQLNIPHKKFPKFVKDSIKEMETNGLTVKTTERDYTDFLSAEDIAEYIND